MLWRCQTACIDALCQLPEGQFGNVRSALGECVEEYLYRLLCYVCGEHNVVRLNKVIRGDRHADFIVVAGSSAIVLECKKTVGSVAAKSIVRPGDLVDMWERFAEGYEQCARVVQHDVWRELPALRAVTSIVSIVCADESLCVEGPLFNSFGQDSGYFGANAIGPTEALSLAELEDALIRIGPQALHDLVQKRWATNSAGRLFSLYFKETGAGNGPRFSNYGFWKDAHDELFPGIKMPLA
jgi:hypothetical protein